VLRQRRLERHVVEQDVEHEGGVGAVRLCRRPQIGDGPVVDGEGEAVAEVEQVGIRGNGLVRLEHAGADEVVEQGEDDGGAVGGHRVSLPRRTSLANF
jgi:hypothetical protein